MSSPAYCSMPRAACWWRGVQRERTSRVGGSFPAESSCRGNRARPDSRASLPRSSGSACLPPVPSSGPSTVIRIATWCSTCGAWGRTPASRTAAKASGVEWREVRRLDPADFPPADAPVLAALRLPRRYLVTPEPGRDWNAFLDRLAARVDQGFDLVQLRAKSLEESALMELGRQVAEICRCGRGDAARERGPRSRTALRRWWRSSHQPATGPDAARAARRGRSQVNLLRSAGAGASAGCPSRRSGGPRIRDGTADFAARRMEGASWPAPRVTTRTISNGHGSRAATSRFWDRYGRPPTHPGAPGLQWDGFERWARGAGLPVFAIGGLGDGDGAAARRSGGQGVAAIRAFWGEA